jgi:Domain of unknown function (DUF3291)
MSQYHVAQVNMGRIRFPLDDSRMSSPACYLALWWVPAGHRPGTDEAKKRIAHLNAHGPTQFAFTFKVPFQPDEEFQRSIDWSSFAPCPSTA